MKKILFWMPRVSAILFSLFILMFSFDVFGTGTLLEQIMGFVLHNIPVFMMWLLIVISWRKDIIAVLGFSVFGLFYFILISMNQPSSVDLMNPVIFIISLPAWMIAAMYGLNYYYNKKGR